MTVTRFDALDVWAFLMVLLGFLAVAVVSVLVLRWVLQDRS